ncbi:MAG: hypothetical protein Q7K11_01650 [Candidatus Berkelbacteria bacterium]|nr:hypothetical protein [Candidatus Berkelbacteria bacterium]
MRFVKGLFSGIIILFILQTIVRSVPYLRANFWDNPKLIFGYHIHDSTFGLFVILLGLLFLSKRKPKGLFLIGAGAGMIIMHTLADGRLIFIE